MESHDKLNLQEKELEDLITKEKELIKDIQSRILQKKTRPIPKVSNNAVGKLTVHLLRESDQAYFDHCKVEYEDEESLSILEAQLLAMASLTQLRFTSLQRSNNGTRFHLKGVCSGLLQFDLWFEGGGGGGKIDHDGQGIVWATASVCPLQHLLTGLAKAPVRQGVDRKRRRDNGYEINEVDSIVGQLETGLCLFSFFRALGSYAVFVRKRYALFSSISSSLPSAAISFPGAGSPYDAAEAAASVTESQLSRAVAACTIGSVLRITPTPSAPGIRFGMELHWEWGGGNEQGGRWGARTGTGVEGTDGNCEDGDDESGFNQWLRVVVDPLETVGGGDLTERQQELVSRLPAVLSSLVRLKGLVAGVTTVIQAATSVGCGNEED